MKDRAIKLYSGGVMLIFCLFLLVGLVVGFYLSIAMDFRTSLYVLIPGVVVWIILLIGFIVNSPNQAKVVQLFGSYKGTLTEVGFFWGNPFYTKQTVSQRVQTFETGIQKSPEVKDATGKVVQESQSRRMPTKVNDKDGTPIEIAAVITFRVIHPAEAVFNIDNYEDFIHVQSDAALRNLASQYHYDGQDDDGFSLRGHIDEVSKKLQHELQLRLNQAGLEVLSAQISSLAYAPEIASAMLQRQQASATIAARRLIVEGAVGMVEHALEVLLQKQIVELDAERKAAMVSNLLVVLCSHTTPQPVLNTGTLHN